MSWGRSRLRVRMASMAEALRRVISWVRSPDSNRMRLTVTVGRCGCGDDGTAMLNHDTGKGIAETTRILSIQSRQPTRQKGGVESISSRCGVDNPLHR